MVWVAPHSTSTRLFQSVASSISLRLTELPAPPPPEMDGSRPSTAEVGGPPDFPPVLDAVAPRG